ncbi:hypothetical protein GCM10025873_09010 [Demequina sediminis]|nr:hypothetical protein GCM10025873_09010 [Demequina sediminis]
MNLSAYEGVSQHASNVSAQQKVAQGIEDHGFGDGGGMLLGMNLAQAINPMTAAPQAPAATPTASTPRMSLDEQIEMVKKLKDLVDAGILTAEEFEAKKKEVLGL